MKKEYVVNRIMKRKFLAPMLAFLAVAFMVGCASIIHGTRQEIGFSSQPTGAKVTVGGRSYGITPVIVDLKRKNTHIVRIEMEGYRPYETTITRKVSAWIVGNILVGGLIGLAVDAIDGAMYWLKPEQVEAILDRQDMGSLYKENTLYVIVVLEPDPQWERIGTLQRAPSE